MSLLDGMIPPTPQCELPDPIRPEGDAGVMVTATCPHCNVLFLLVGQIQGERWLEAQAWWDECRRDEWRSPRLYRKEGEYYAYRQYEKYRIEPNEYLDCSSEVDSADQNG